MYWGELSQSNFELRELQQQSWPGSSELPWYLGTMITWVKSNPHPDPHEPEHKAQQGEQEHLEQGKELTMLATWLLDKPLLSRAHAEWLTLEKDK